MMSARRQSLILAAIGFGWLVFGLLLPLEYAALLPAGLFVLGAISFFIRCPRCRQPALQRHVRLFGETWTVGWIPAPRTCVTCGQDLTIAMGTQRARSPATGGDRRESWSRSKLAAYMAFCGAASAGGALLAWRDHEVLVALGGLALAAALWLAGGIVWYRARRC